MTTNNYDVAVIGAGVFGAWIARYLQLAGRSVILIDAYGPSNSRASSGGESRIIRLGYGADEIYSRFSMRALDLWKQFFAQTGEQLFHPTGLLLPADEGDTVVTVTESTLQKLGVKTERLSRQELGKRFPQFAKGKIAWALFEPDSGVLMARRAVQSVVRETLKDGADYLLGNRIFPTRQEILFFGAPAGDASFKSPSLPAWIYRADGMYGMPDIENRGVKISNDNHGPGIDPDTDERTVTPESIAAVRDYLTRLFPALKDAPLLETRVCQYENTSNGDFLIDHHPEFSNVWLVGGGSGHGFKHGPALGEYVARLALQGGDVDPRFSLATKEIGQKRAVY